MGGDVIEIKRALPFLGAALAERQQPAKPAVSGAIARINQQARRVLQIEPGADDEFDADFLGGQMAAHDAGKRVAVGDGDGVESKRLGRRHQLLGMGAAAQEGEIGGDVELGVAGHGEWRSPEDAVQIPAGRPELALLIEAFAEHPVAVPVLVLDAVIVARPCACSLPLGGGRRRGQLGDRARNSTPPGSAFGHATLPLKGRDDWRSCAAATIPARCAQALRP